MYLFLLIENKNVLKFMIRRILILLSKNRKHI